jgi:hypothetical protein
MKYSMIYGGQVIGHGLASGDVDRIRNKIDENIAAGMTWIYLQFPSGDGVLEHWLHVGPSTAIGFIASDAT